MAGKYKIEKEEDELIAFATPNEVFRKKPHKPNSNPSSSQNSPIGSPKKPTSSKPPSATAPPPSSSQSVAIPSVPNGRKYNGTGKPFPDAFPGDLNPMANSLADLEYDVKSKRKTYAIGTKMPQQKQQQQKEFQQRQHKSLLVNGSKTGGGAQYSNIQLPPNSYMAKQNTSQSLPNSPQHKSFTGGAVPAGADAGAGAGTSSKINLKPSQTGTSASQIDNQSAAVFAHRLSSLPPNPNRRTYDGNILKITHSSSSPALPNPQLGSGNQKQQQKQTAQQRYNRNSTPDLQYSHNPPPIPKIPAQYQNDSYNQYRYQQSPHEYQYQNLSLQPPYQTEYYERNQQSSSSGYFPPVPQQQSSQQPQSPQRLALAHHEQQHYTQPAPMQKQHSPQRYQYNENDQVKPLRIGNNKSALVTATATLPSSQQEQEQQPMQPLKPQAFQTYQPHVHQPPPQQQQYADMLLNRHQNLDQNGTNHNSRQAKYSVSNVATNSAFANIRQEENSNKNDNNINVNNNSGVFPSNNANSASLQEAVKVEEKLRFIFDAVNATRSGVLNPTELQKALLNTDNSKFRLSTVKIMIKLFDKSSKNGIDFREFYHLWSYVSRWRKIFLEYSKFDNGTSITINQYQEALEALGYNMGQETVSYMFDIFATTGESAVDQQVGIKSLKLDMFVESLVWLMKSTSSFKRFDVQRNGVGVFPFDNYVQEILSFRYLD